MVAILSVAEKPSVAKELAAIISRCNPDALRRPGLSPYNHIFEIERCSFRDQPASMRMTSVLGHLMELEFDAKYRSWHSCSPSELFTAPVHKTVKTENDALRRTLIAEAQRAQVLLLWLDCDLEGENIAFEVMQVCQQANPRLDIYRARFSALIERDILRTLRVPDRPNAHMSQAVEARQEIDLRIGAAFTRFQTLRLQRKFDIGKQVVSYGPCQFPTLGFVVERDLAIKSFRSEAYWHISCEADLEEAPGAKKLHCSFSWSRGRVYDHFAALILYESCFTSMENDVNAVNNAVFARLHENNANNNNNNNNVRAVATVVSCQERPTSKRKPVPLNTIDFQILASRHLRMSSQEAMEIAESLYQRGIVSYPRTETNFFKEGFDLQALVVEQRKHSVWGGFAQRLIFANEEQEPGTRSLFEWPRIGGKDDQAHPPIHPTKCVELTQLENEKEKKIYELITRHFLACCSLDARGSQSTIGIEIPRRGESFTTYGLVVSERNYLDVYTYESWGGREKLPVLPIGATFSPSSLMLCAGETTAPEPLSESDLIALMDKHGIGTDATIAQHINTIQTREYVTKDARQRFVPTPLGIALCEGYNAMGYQLNKPQLRAAIESDCQRVAKGELSREEAVRKSLTLMQTCFERCSREAHLLDEAMRKYFAEIGAGQSAQYDVIERNLSSCGVCHEGMELRMLRDNNNNNNERERKRFLYCHTCQKALPMPLRGALSQHELSCAICGFQVLSVRNAETGKEHTICPYCFSNPPADMENMNEFRCFSCAREDCSLAGRVPGLDVDVTVCRTLTCRGQMRLKKNSKGFILACNTKDCRSTWWLPKFITSAIPQADEVCVRCQQREGVSVRKLAVRVNTQLAPPGVAPTQTVCPACDPLWAQTDSPALPLRRSAPQNMPSHTQMQTPHTKQAPPPRASVATHHTPLHNPFAPPTPAPTHAHTPLNPPSRPPLTSFFASPSPLSAPTQPPAYNNAHMGSNYSYSASSSSSSFPPPPHNVHTPYHNHSSSYNAYTSFSSAPSPHTTHSSYAPVPTPTHVTHTLHASHTSSHSSHTAHTTDISAPQCSCGTPSRQLTVHKEGPNKGRVFFACAGGREGCGFFQWADDNSGSGSVVSGMSGGGRSSMSVSSAVSGSAPMCSCGERATVQTTLKEGPNKNRQFYTCAKRRGDATRCEFFKWVDGGGAGGGAPSDVICSICRQGGHYARQCPNK